MPIVEVNGQEFEFPDDMQPEAIKDVLRTKFPPTPQQPDSFSQRLQADFARRRGQIGGLKDLADSGGISQAEGAVRSGLKMAQLLPDTAGNVLSTVTPDFIEKPIVQGIGDAASYLADTRAGRYAVREVNDFIQRDPINAGRDQIGKAGHEDDALYPDLHNQLRSEDG